jgi:hypothetical protein
MKYQHNAGYRIRNKIDSESRARQVNVLCLASFSPVSCVFLSCVQTFVVCVSLWEPCLNIQ